MEERRGKRKRRRDGKRGGGRVEKGGSRFEDPHAGSVATITLPTPWYSPRKSRRLLSRSCACAALLAPVVVVVGR